MGCQFKGTNHWERDANSPQAGRCGSEPVEGIIAPHGKIIMFEEKTGGTSFHGAISSRVTDGGEWEWHFAGLVGDYPELKAMMEYDSTFRKCIHCTRRRHLLFTSQPTSTPSAAPCCDDWQWCE